MEVRLLKSASVLIAARGVKLLCDPWLVDGEYFGSWAHYPPYDFDVADFADLDFIYISHIHPDHFSRKTLSLLPRHVPVLIHAYATPFLRTNIESLGFRVHELPHRRRTHLKNGVHINILAADNCDPALCGRFFGCAQVEKTFGSTQIDSLAVIDDGRYVVLNVNDCPFELARASLALVGEQYAAIDLLLTGYAGAGPWPQCFPQLPRDERDRAAAAKKRQFLEQAEAFVNTTKPKHYLPFAGTYTLAGKLARLNAHRGVPELDEARDFFRRAGSPIDPGRSRCVALAAGARLDLAGGDCGEQYVPVDRAAKARYIDEVLAARPLDYEACRPPDMAELKALAPQAYQRLERRRRQLGFHSPTKVYISLGDALAARLSLAGEGIDFVAEESAEEEERFVLFRADPRLLLWLLKGPRFAHWNNAEIGSHLELERRPNTFERGLYHLMCWFHE
ncbi:MAG TPA: MBL fold metallo-hydrolase [Pirellulales bacterium]